jgi:hypothetical protein|nr:MAG TPA: hypothetical protein [Caudoviricetes sp.]
MTERQRNIELAVEKSMNGRSWLMGNGEFWAVNTSMEENYYGMKKGFVIEQCYIDGVAQMPVEVMKVKTPKQAYEQILEEYHKNSVCLGELMAQFEIQGLSAEDVIWVYAELLRDIDGSSLEVDGEEYIGRGRKWD